MALCDRCSSVPFASLPPLPQYYQSGSSGYQYIEAFHVFDKTAEDDLEIPGIPYHPDLESLQRSAKDCKLCQLILEATEKVILELSTNTEEKKLRLNSFPDILTYNLSLTRRRLGDGFWVMSTSDNPWAIYLVAAIGFCVKNESSLASFIKGRPVAEDPTDETTLARVMAWVNECNTHHDCQQEPRPLPLRVLDLSSGRINLHETSGELGAYITLSHCWGSSKQFTTTKTTLASRKAGIDYELLPKTYQDAIFITRLLGIRYLWIDSLCICQDDNGDWQRESAKMGLVYSNAYLTIAAASAKDSSVGLFTHRVPHTFLPLLQEEIYTWRILDLGDEPLSQRAWALQERALANRTLIYGTYQVYFECGVQFMSENGFHLQERYINMRSNYNIIASGPKEFYLEKDSRARVFEEWAKLLGMYSDRQLTKSSDKLPALSGLAKIYSERLKDHYIAGLWRNSLVEGLSWTTFGPGVRRVPEYRAPSWSWASIDGYISANELPLCSHEAAILDCHVELKGSNPFGEVSSGWIKLRALLVPLFLNEKIDPDGFGVPYAKNPLARTENGDPNGTYSRFDIDFSNITMEGAQDLVRSMGSKKLYALMLGKTTEDDELSYFSLIVTPTEAGPYTMQRLGYIVQNENCMGPLDAASEKPIITLV